MSVSRDREREACCVQCRYRGLDGRNQEKDQARVQDQEKARKWEYKFLKRMKSASIMLFSELYEIYVEDAKMRLRQTICEPKKI